MYEGCATTLEEYIKTVWKHHGKCDVENYAKIPQPVYTAHNYYGDGVIPYERDDTSAKTSLASEAKITVENDGVYLEMDLDASFDSIEANIVDMQNMPLPRITECPYEDANGNNIRITNDIFGSTRRKTPTIGPIEGIHSGKVRVKIK